MTERFKKAYDSLVRAFFEGTLAKSTCTACACGNIIFDAIGEPVTREDLMNEVRRKYGESIPKRQRAIDLWATKRTPSGYGKFVAYDCCSKLVNAAGYTAKEFAEIETAFEQNTEIRYSLYDEVDEGEILEDQYKGLCAVVDVLMELDKMPQGGDAYKQEFRKHPKLVTT